jgi:hypothetical protein
MVKLQRGFDSMKRDRRSGRRFPGPTPDCRHFEPVIALQSEVKSVLRRICGAAAAGFLLGITALDRVNTRLTPPLPARNRV